MCRPSGCPPALADRIASTPDDYFAELGVTRDYFSRLATSYAVLHQHLRAACTAPIWSPAAIDAVYVLPLAEIARWQTMLERLRQQ